MAITEEQLKMEWEKADKDKSNSLTCKEITSLLHKLNLKLKDKEIKKKFKEVDKDGNGDLDYDEFVDFLERLRVRPEIEEIFSKFADSKTNTLSAEQLVKFLQTIQKETTADLAYAKTIISEFEKKIHSIDPDPTELHINGFSHFLTSEKYNHVFNPKHGSVYQDMTQPFAHYFIASSHNTYLMGDQLKGESSVDAYINAFSKGCKCVELDCWDGTDKSMPIIYHGHTLTSKITFREVVETVRDHGFKVSPYPVILSLEVHCGIEGQQAMAAIIKDVLGDAGFLPDQFEQTGVLPCPEKLQNKVLLKGKMVAFSDKDEEEAEEEELEDYEDTNKGKKSPKASDKKDKKAEKGKEGKEEKKPKKEEKKHESTAKELSDLIHLKAVKFPGFADYKTKNKAWEMSSFSEGNIAKFLAKSSIEYVEYNSRQLSRIFPKGMRIDSSNYDPSAAWACGCQIVALNYQTGTEPMFANVGKFQDNGTSGYILKPEYMRDAKKMTTYNPADAKLKLDHKIKSIEIQVISGWQLPKADSKGKGKSGKGEVIDPYVKISLNGMPADKKSVKTKVIKNNGFNPVWKAAWKFPLVNPELATVTFLVADADFVSSDDFIAQYSLRLNNLREGYRYIPLKDMNGKKFDDSSLLIYTKFY